MRKFATLLFLISWALYLLSLYLPCARIQNPDGNRGQALAWDGRTTDLPGYQLLQIVVNPLAWIFVTPFFYCGVNLVFWSTPISFVYCFRGDGAPLFGIVTAVAALAAWMAPYFLLNVFPGYFAWSASITLAAIALLIPMKGEDSAPATPGTAVNEVPPPRSV